MTLRTAYASLGPKSTLASGLKEYTTDDFVALSFPGAIAGAAVTTELDKTSDATLAAIPGLSIPLPVGTFVLEAYLPGTAGASGGAKVSLDTSDTLVATSVSFTAQFNAAAATATVAATAMATGVGSTAAVIETVIDGVIVVGTAGTLVVKFAQNASNGTASSVYVNGHLKVTRIA